MMARSRKRRYLVLTGAAIVVALMALIVGSFLSRSALEAQTTTTAAASSISQLEAVPPKATTGPSAAPAESGGEPFKTCQICHPDFMQKPGTAGDLVFSHKTHLDQSVSCATCHPSPLGHFGRPTPMMTTCLSCHQGETAPNDCKNCHRKLDQIAPGLGKQVVHLDPDAKTRHTCAKCHDVNVWCEKCHGVAMPHPPAWPQIHGGYATADPDGLREVPPEQGQDVLRALPRSGDAAPLLLVLEPWRHRHERPAALLQVSSGQPGVLRQLPPRGLLAHGGLAGDPARPGGWPTGDRSVLRLPRRRVLRSLSSGGPVRAVARMCSNDARPPGIALVKFATTGDFVDNRRHCREKDSQHRKEVSSCQRSEYRSSQRFSPSF